MIYSGCRSHIFENKNFRPEFGSNGLNQVEVFEVFGHFLEFGSLVFLKIAYSDSLQQCQTSSGGKINEKKLGAQN